MRLVDQGQLLANVFPNNDKCIARAAAIIAAASRQHNDKQNSQPPNKHHSSNLLQTPTCCNTWLAAAGAAAAPSQPSTMHIEHTTLTNPHRHPPLPSSFSDTQSCITDLYIFHRLETQNHNAPEFAAPPKRTQCRRKRKHDAPKPAGGTIEHPSMLGNSIQGAPDLAGIQSTPKTTLPNNIFVWSSLSPGSAATSSSPPGCCSQQQRAPPPQTLWCCQALC